MTATVRRTVRLVIMFRFAPIVASRDSGAHHCLLVACGERTRD
jgi:hypothetical protein